MIGLLESKGWNGVIRAARQFGNIGQSRERMAESGLQALAGRKHSDPAGEPPAAQPSRKEGKTHPRGMVLP
ncbi:hypothetical protein VE23_13375 [Paenibacillus sp. D9]|nr:hypothetical protein VE23_13375 [Paenibacillus sp. D9]